MGGFQFSAPDNQDSKILRLILNHTIVGKKIHQNNYSQAFDCTELPKYLFQEFGLYC